MPGHLPLNLKVVQQRYTTSGVHFRHAGRSRSPFTWAIQARQHISGVRSDHSCKLPISNAHTSHISPRALSSVCVGQERRRLANSERIATLKVLVDGAISNGVPRILSFHFIRIRLIVSIVHWHHLPFINCKHYALTSPSIFNCKLNILATSLT